jgi:NADH:ubiquinone oxidoreductase subunit 3 (subunit A)
MIIFAIILSSLLIIVSYLISHKNSYPVSLGIVSDESERRSQYECGLEPFEEKIGIETRERFYIKFYIIGILFLIFDLETLLLYPFTLVPSSFNYDLSFYTITNISFIKPFITFLIFISLLLLGLFYEYRKNVL